MNLIQKIAVFYLVALGFMAWGIAIGKYEVFPFLILKEFQDFVEGDPLGRDTSVADKMLNDLGLEPRRHLREYPANAAAGTRAIEVPGLKDRREIPLVFVSPDHQEGYRAIFGAFDFENSFWGGILLGPAGELLQTWDLSTDHLPMSKGNDELRNLYGVHISSDGSVIFTQQEDGGGIVKVDGCGKILWSLEGYYHHAISPTEDGNFWTFVGKEKDLDHKLAKISMETGEIETVIDMREVRKRNPFVHIFNLQIPSLQGYLENADVSHGNDIAPLFSDRSAQFKGFEPGDLLISYRTQNLVFVLDPDTLKIKWWRIGPWDRQHDPDWEADGTITVFSNNQVTDRPVSDIVSIDPDSFESRVIVDGENYNFYSAINGSHQSTEFGTILVSSTTQGWAFEVDRDNQVVFSFVNNYDSKNNKSLNVSAAYRLPERYFDEKFWEKCAK
ncbi:arylsulfotransferase family protein [Pseudomonadota bacterium]